MEKISQYCQKCRAANEPGAPTCRRCGTRLMLVVIPPSVRHEESFAPSYYEDHLLERVSLLELRLAQLAERLSTALELMLRQAKTTQSAHFLLETVIESLNTLGVSEKETLARIARARVEAEDLKEAEENRREQVLKNILLRHDGQNAELFARLVKEGIKHLSAGEEKQGFRTLERAAQISPRNLALLIFLAENLFRADKFDEAEKYLEKILEIAPQEPKALLLSGIIHADRGDAENARRLLSVASGKPEAAFCVNYAWGLLAALEENWTEALGAFTMALKARDLPETHYLTACAYFQLGRRTMAAKHLQTALERDENFADAWFMLGVIASQEGDNIKSAESFARAWEAKEAGAQCLEFLKRKNSTELARALPFLRFSQPSPKHILTGGSRRLSKIFCEELYKLL